MTSQSNHYETAAGKLTGADAERALRAAQNHLDATSPDYLTDFKRLQSKLIAVLGNVQ